MALNARLIRVLRGVRRWRGQAPDAPIPVDQDLPDGDWRHLGSTIDATVENRGGPVASRHRARTIALTYAGLNATGRLRFLQRLADDYGHDDTAVDEAIEAVLAADDPQQRRAAESLLRTTLRPRREVLFRRLASLDGGLPFLVEMRSDLLPHRRSSPGLAAADADLRSILEGWFDVGMLRLVRLTWDTPASFLEKLIDYEAVHAIESWDDLKRRLAPDRRCYAFVHPGMPDDLLIFVEVALTKNIARELSPLLAPAAEGPFDEAAIDEDEFDTAIFYSISNCHDGLAGVSLGDFLIKSVVEELSAELPRLKTFATLSPMPGFRAWLRELVDGDDALLHTTQDGANSGRVDGSPAGDGNRLRPAIAEFLDGPMPDADSPAIDDLRADLLRLAAEFLLHARKGDRAADPVAHFHLSNGARVEHLNWMANPSPVGWDRGLAMMVNYRYDLKTIERNHDAYVNSGRVAAADDVKDLVDG